MLWVAPPEKNAANNTLERRLWAAADQFRANSGLKAAQYSAPVLGLIFLRFAEARFAQRRAAIEKAGKSGRRSASRIDEPAAYHAEGVLFLTPSARFDYLLQRPEGSNVGKAVNEAMADVEKHNPQLGGVLPRNYQIFNGTLLKELLKKVSEIPVSLDYDAFGRIYEYFLGQFARTEGQKGGEFYTPAPIVRLMVEILEPFHGRILDPACGSGGMFVQSARFVAEHKKNPSSELSIFGVEKTDETGRLCRMNLAVHGLEGDIRHGGEVNSYYDDPHKAVGAFDFALANPPFNVNAVDKDRLKDAVGPGRRFPFGLPRTDNANYLWIQLFYSSLNDKGRAAFVMANSASDARASELEIRKQLIQSRAVDAVVAVGPNMFYTVTLPCTLWFLDRGKKKTPRADQVLFIDARHIYRQIDRAHRDWTEAQVSFLANIVRIYRGEEPDFAFGGEEAKEKLVEVFGKKANYTNVAGLCKAVTLTEIDAQGWSLNPGRFVGVTPGEDVSDEDFKVQLETLNEELEALNAQAHELEQTIAGNVAEILDE
ncbi:MAG: N-6 DNA methylase [Burkholderiales bacterium]